MPFTDEDLKRLKDGIKTGNFDWTEALLPQQMHALLARMEAHEELDPYFQHGQMCTFWMAKTTCSCGLWEKQEAWRKAAGKDKS